MKFSGRLYHKFHGSYFAVVALHFSSEDEAKQALTSINESVYQLSPNSQYVLLDGQHCLRLVLSPEELEKFKAWCSGFKRTDAPCTLFDCKRKKNQQHAIDSVAHSVDAGPLFHFES